MRRHITFCLLCLLLLASLLSACGKGEPEPAVTDAAQTTLASATAQTEAAAESVEIAARGKKSAFQIVYDTEDDASGKYALRLLNAVKDGIDVSMTLRADYLAAQETPCEIVVGAKRRPECAALTETLGEEEYVIQTVREGDKTKIIIAY